MAVDIFLDILDTQGDSTDLEFPGSIMIKEWSWGLRSSGSATESVGTIQNVTVKKDLDRSSVNLWQYCLRHTDLHDVVFYFRKAGITPLPYLTFTLHNTRIVSVDTEVGSVSEIPHEVVVFSFNGFVAEYQPQGNDGMPDGGVIMWDYGASPEG